MRRASPASPERPPARAPASWPCSRRAPAPSRSPRGRLPGAPGAPRGRWGAPLAFERSLERGERGERRRRSMRIRLGIAPRSVASLELNTSKRGSRIRNLRLLVNPKCPLDLQSSRVWAHFSRLTFRKLTVVSMRRTGGGILIHFSPRR